MKNENRCLVVFLSDNGNKIKYRENGKVIYSTWKEDDKISRGYMMTGKHCIPLDQWFLKNMKPWEALESVLRD